MFHISLLPRRRRQQISRSAIRFEIMPVRYETPSSDERHELRELCPIRFSDRVEAERRAEVLRSARTFCGPDDELTIEEVHA